MKHFLIIVSILTSSINALAQNGGCGGHGGDAISQEFFQIGRSLLGQIRKLSNEELGKLQSQFNVDLFELSVLKAHIVSTDEKLYRNRAEVDAQNFESPLEIKINRARWLQYRDQIAKKEGIALHEYLGILKSLSQNRGEWDEYALSIQILTLLSQKKQTSKETNAFNVAQIEALFETGAPLTPGTVERGLTYSCVEYSLLSNEISPIAIKDTYTAATLNSSSSQQFEPQTETLIQEELRLTSRGDLVIKKVDTEDQHPVSMKYCSKLGSKTVQMIRFLSESLLPIFDTPKTEGFSHYRDQMNGLYRSSLYQRCAKTASTSACMKFLKRFGSVKLDAETQAILSAKSNIVQINQWLNTLGQNKFLVNTPLLDLMDKYAVHQDYMQTLLDLKDARDPDGFKNFIDSLQNRLPEAYESAKSQFIQQTSSTILDFIESFSPKF